MFQNSGLGIQDPAFELSLKTQTLGLGFQDPACSSGALSEECMRYYTPLCLDCKFRDASRGADINCGPNSGDISAGNSDGISADDSKGISTSNSVCISMIVLHSPAVPFSLITPYQHLNFLAPEHRIPIWVILGLGFSVDDIVKDMKLLIFC